MCKNNCIHMSFCFPLISLQICKEKRSNISAINQSKKTVDIQNIQIEKTRKTEKQQKYKYKNSVNLATEC